MQQPNIDQRPRPNGQKSSGGIMAVIQFYGRETKKPKLQPGFSAAPPTSQDLAIIRHH